MHIWYCFIEINSKDEISSSWKKQEYENWSSGPGELKMGYRKERFTLRVVRCWSRTTQRDSGTPSFGDAQNLSHMTLERIGPGTSGVPFQSKCFIIRCCFVDDPYLNHNFSCLILQFIIVKCKDKAVFLADSKFSNVKSISRLFWCISWILLR